MTLHGVAVETGDDAAVREMAECFVEEYARMGFGADRILRMFATKGYAGPHLAYRLLGEAAIGAMVRKVLERWGPAVRPDAVAEPIQNGLALRVLDS